MQRKIIFIHLLNDFSGSPRVLKSVIYNLLPSYPKSILFVSNATSGILNDLPLSTRFYWYSRSRFSLLNWFYYIFSQVSLFISLCLCKDIKKDDVIYINTMLPFGAALYGFIFSRKIVYHIHENLYNPFVISIILRWINRFSSSLNIFVSQSHYDNYKIKRVKSLVVFNTLSEDFSECRDNFHARVYKRLSDNNKFVVLMLSSLREYKGVFEFVKLSYMMRDDPIFKFILIANESQSTIDIFLKNHLHTSNLTIRPATQDPSAYYKQSNVLLNLTRVDLCIETFGMTILEAISFALPAIVPPVGGPAEIIRNGIDGFHIDSRNIIELKNKITLLKNNKSLYLEFARASYERSFVFSNTNFKKNLLSALK